MLKFEDLSVLDSVEQSKNKAMIIGRISENFRFNHQGINGECYYKTVVSVLRKSGQKDNIVVVLPERFIGKHKENSIGKFIRLFGSFCSHLHKNEGSKNWLELYVLAESAEFFNFYELENFKINNIVYLSGRVQKPTYFRKNGHSSLADVFISVNRDNLQNKHDYIPCIAWGKLAYIVSNLQVGDWITIIGRIQSREYLKGYDENGNPIYREVYEVSIFNILDITEN